ncbi:MAG: TolC family protein [Acidobacteria bacterium]|nr:TolC family protein [Acidobacteriota bacterium]MCI0719096.1 TolC family protein [Acidobacteriota bacterium]
MIRQVLVFALVWLSSELPLRAQAAAQTGSAINDGRDSQERQIGGSESLVALAVSDTDGITIEELVNLTLSQNKQLEVVRAQLRQAEARMTQARLRPNPSLDVEHGSDVFFANEGERGYNVALSQPFELGGKRAKRIQVATAYGEMIKAQIADVERQFATRVRLLFGEALGAAAQLDQLEQVAKLNQEMVRIMKVRLDSGDAARLDQHLLLATTNQLEAQRLQVQSQLAGLVLEIKTLAGLPPEDRFVLKRALLPQEIGTSQEAAVAMALESRPDWRRWLPTNRSR